MAVAYSDEGIHEDHRSSLQYSGSEREADLSPTHSPRHHLEGVKSEEPEDPPQGPYTPQDQSSLNPRLYGLSSPTQTEFGWLQQALSAASPVHTGQDTPTPSEVDFPKLASEPSTKIVQPLCKPVG